MSEKPTCSLLDTDGNAFMIIGTVAKTLRRAGLEDERKEFSAKALEAPSYDALLQLVMEYVDVE